MARGDRRRHRRSQASRGRQVRRAASFATCAVHASSTPVMTTLIALLRAINVTGTGILKMEDLRAICTRLGFSNPRTYIASGNLVVGSKLSPAAAKSKLEKALHTKLGKPCRVIIRDLAELEATERANPFP